MRLLCILAVAGMSIVGAGAAGIEIGTLVGRWRAGGYVEGEFVVPSDGDSPPQRPEGIVDLGLVGDVHPLARLTLGARTVFGGPPENADGFGVFNLRDVFQNRSPSLEFTQGTLDLFLPRVDLRLGLQKVTWGRLDTFQPTDVVSPRQYSDPFLTDANDAKIGIPAVSASFFPPDPPSGFVRAGSLTVIWVPIPIPFRFPLQDERWFPPAASVPPTVQIPAGALGTGLPGVVIHTVFRTANADPDQRLSQGAVGLHLSGLSGGVDWSAYFYDGRETAPAFDLLTSVQLAPRPGDPSPDIQLQGNSILRPRFDQMWLAGGDAAFQLAGFTARAEAIYGAGRLEPRSTADLLSLDNIKRAVGSDAPAILRQLLMGKTVPIDLGNLFERRDIIDWGAGLDYEYAGWTPVLQVNQTAVLNNDVNLLVSNIDTRLLAAVRKSFFADRLATEIVAVQGLARSYTTALARFTYAVTDDLRVRIGYLVIGGSRNTVLGQYKDNDELFFQIRYAR